MSRLPAAVVAGAGAVAAGWYAWLLVARDNGLATYAYDQAFFQQLTWRLGHGYGFTSSFVEGSFLGLHFEPLLVLPALAERAWADPRLLSIAVAIGIGALAPSAFLFVNAATGRPWLAAALSAPVPFWPALQEMARSGFHPEVAGPSLALGAGWAGLTGRRGACWALALVALMAKEDQAWNVLVIGLVLMSRGPSRRLGAQVAAAALAWGVAVVGVVMPILKAGHRVDTDTYYGWLAGASPAAIVHALAAPGGWAAAGVLLLGAGGLPLLRPWWLLPALPPLAADLLSAHDPQPLLHLQYALPLVLPVLVAAATAAGARGGRALAAAPVAGALIAAVGLGSMPPALAADASPFSRPAAVARLTECVAPIPAEAAVAADDPLLAILAARPTVRELTNAAPGDYLVVDRQAWLPGYVGREQRDAAAAGSGRRTLCDDGRFVVMAPVGPGSGAR